MSNFFFILTKEVDYNHVKVKLLIIMIIEVLVNHFVCVVLSIVDKEAYMSILHAVEVALG